MDYPSLTHVEIGAVRYKETKYTTGFQNFYMNTSTSRSRFFNFRD